MGVELTTLTIIGLEVRCSSSWANQTGVTWYTFKWSFFLNAPFYFLDLDHF